MYLNFDVTVKFCDKYLLLTAFRVSPLDYCYDDTINFSLSLCCHVESYKRNKKINVQ